MGNILQNSLDVTYEDFLKGVFGVRPKPERTALKTLFSEIVVGKSTLVSDMSKPLRANASKAEWKRAQERVSGWLGNYGFVGVLAYVYATQFLRKTKGFKKILKFIADNLGTVSSKTHALLAGIRALVKEARIRFISGRPRRRTVDDRQMALPGF